MIPQSPIKVTEGIKKSEFITFLAHTEGVAASKAYIQLLKSQYPDARHHCSAFVAGRPDNQQLWGCNDDGEPSGTAGKPMLAQLCGANVGEITAVIVRYFGGVKLGTGIPILIEVYPLSEN